MLASPSCAENKSDRAKTRKAKDASKDGIAQVDWRAGRVTRVYPGGSGPEQVRPSVVPSTLAGIGAAIESIDRPPGVQAPLISHTTRPKTVSHPPRRMSAEYQTCGVRGAGLKGGLPPDERSMNEGNLCKDRRDRSLASLHSRP